MASLLPKHAVREMHAFGLALTFRRIVAYHSVTLRVFPMSRTSHFRVRFQLNDDDEKKFTRGCCMSDARNKRQLSVHEQSFVGVSNTGDGLIDLNTVTSEEPALFCSHAMAEEAKTWIPTFRSLPWQLVLPTPFKRVDDHLKQAMRHVGATCKDVHTRGNVKITASFSGETKTQLFLPGADPWQWHEVVVESPSKRGKATTHSFILPYSYVQRAMECSAFDHGAQSTPCARE